MPISKSNKQRGQVLDFVLNTILMAADTGQLEVAQTYKFEMLGYLKLHRDRMLEGDPKILEDVSRLLRSLFTEYEQKWPKEVISAFDDIKKGTKYTVMPDQWNVELLFKQYHLLSQFSSGANSREIIQQKFDDYNEFARSVKNINTTIRKLQENIKRSGDEVVELNKALQLRSNLVEKKLKPIEKLLQEEIAILQNGIKTANVPVEKSVKEEYSQRAGAGLDKTRSATLDIHKAMASSKNKDCETVLKSNVVSADEKYLEMLAQKLQRTGVVQTPKKSRHDATSQPSEDEHSQKRKPKI